MVAITEKLHRRLAKDNIHVSQGSLEFHLCKVLNEERIPYEEEPSETLVATVNERPK